MCSRVLSITFLVLALSALTVAAAASARVQLIVAYCPTDFTGAGAIVSVDARTGNWTVDTTFKFPSEIFGCVADYDPTYSLDPRDPNTLWFDFTSQAGYFLAVDTRLGNTTAVSSSSLFFSGFLDFAVFTQTNTLRGITGTVTESGYCSDGCLGYGIQDITNAKYDAKATLPFKETADDARYVDYATNRFYFQAAYDLNSTGCAPTADEHCFLTLDAETGDLLSAVHAPHRYQVYKYGRALSKDGDVRAFMLGFPQHCNTTGAATLFGNVNLRSGVATPLACVNTSLVIDADQWVSSFSVDESILATASGNGEGAPPQFLSFDAATGAVLVDSTLAGLATALHADMKLIFVWGVEVLSTVKPTIL